MKFDKFKYFYPEKPVLMSVDQKEFLGLSNSDDWIAEPKYNGNRCMLWVIDGKVEFWSRHGKKLAYNQNPDPDLVRLISKKFPKGLFLFDSELRHGKVVGVRDKIIIWDVFIFRNEFMDDIQYSTRRAILMLRFKEGDEYGWNAEQGFFDDTFQVTLINQFSGGFKTIFDSYADDNEIEGLVMKRLDGKLNLGRNSAQESDWMLKVRKASGRYKF